MFPYPPQCTKQTRTQMFDNNTFQNSLPSLSNNIPQQQYQNNQQRDFLKPMMSNTSIPVNNHDPRNIVNTRGIDKNYRPVQSAMQSDYQFFNAQIKNNQLPVLNDEFRNPVNTRRDMIEKSRISDNKQFMSVQGGPINNFQDLRCINTRQYKNTDVNTASYTPMARTMAIPRENI